MKEYKFKAGDIIKAKNADDYVFITKICGHNMPNGREEYYCYYYLGDPESTYRQWIYNLEKTYEKVN